MFIIKTDLTSRFFCYVELMNVEQYLARIKFTGTPAPDLSTLKALHKQHLLHIPFEDLDIHYKRFFDLEPGNVYNKVVNNNRGGFCYEVNSLFNELLIEVGFKTTIIPGRVITDTGETGPEYDHMAIRVALDKSFIADVGFGDLFVEPLEIRPGVQHDGRKYFKIEDDGTGYSIYMSPDGVDFQKKYTFTLAETPIGLFEGPCRDKQVNANSHFVRNTICTKLTATGRITIYNEKFIETDGGQKTQSIIRNDEELKEILKNRFGIIVEPG